MYEKQKKYINDKNINVNEASFELRSLELKKDLIRRVNEKFRKFILDGNNIYDYIENEKEIFAAVLAMDIRKSTFMMLKSTAADFSRFMTNIIRQMVSVIHSNHGIFEKFTGDGFIAFFLKKLLQKDTINFAIKAAQECRVTFWEYFEDNNDIFNSMASEFGVSFGIDYGKIHVSSINAELNIIGNPVVYACRMSASEKNNIILNHAAKIELDKNNTNKITYNEIIVDVKNEPEYLGYLINKEIIDSKLSEPNYS